MFMCNRCETVLDDLPTHTELRPYGEGYAYETMTDWGCSCGGTYEYAEVCEKCGDVKFLDSLLGGICEDCREILDEVMIDFEEVA